MYRVRVSRLFELLAILRYDSSFVMILSESKSGCLRQPRDESGERRVRPLRDCGSAAANEQLYRELDEGYCDTAVRIRLRFVHRRAMVRSPSRRFTSRM